MVELAEDLWRQRRRAHHDRVDAWIGPYLRRRSAGLSHPVDDFLFTYYSFRPSALRRWHPGLGVTLLGDGVGELTGTKGYAVAGGRAEADLTGVSRLAGPAAWIRRLLLAVSRRPPVLGCFGLHEWAMVYRQPADDLRHASYPLRLGPHGTDEVVETHRLTCTHADAFRFFTEPARALNVVQPVRDRQVELEQPGCLHATMDCYKWAYKLSPLVGSELVADCFALAREVRSVDMRAAPYDLSALGVEPIRIETSGGKSTYLAAQSDFAARATVLRGRIVDVCDAILAAAQPAGPREPLSRRDPASGAART